MVQKLRRVKLRVKIYLSTLLYSKHSNLTHKKGLVECQMHGTEIIAFQLKFNVYSNKLQGLSQ